MAVDFHIGWNITRQTMIQPYKKYVLVRVDPEEDERTTAAGIIIKEHYKKREDMTVHLRWGTVEALGAETEPLKVGMRVAYNPFDAHPSDDTHELIPISGIRAWLH